MFDILDRRTDEVKTHSAMLAELLNPTGSHNMGEKFLLLFLKMLQNKKETQKEWGKAIFPGNNIKKVKIDKKKHIGKVSGNF